MIRFFEFLGNHPVSWYVDTLLLGCCNHVKQQTLYFRFMSPCQVFLHRSGTFGVELVNHFQVVADWVFGKFDA